MISLSKRFGIVFYEFNKNNIYQSELRPSSVGHAYIGCILGDIKKGIIYSIGINLYNTDLNVTFKKYHAQTIHAEENACYRLPYNKNKRTKKVDIIVFRTNKKGDLLMMSKSCCNCKYHLKKTFVNKKYSLRNFYYTDNNGSLVKDYLK